MPTAKTDACLSWVTTIPGESGWPVVRFVMVI